LGAATQEGRDLELVALLGRRRRRRGRLPALGHRRVLPATLPGGHVELVVGDQTVAADGPPARLHAAQLRPVTSHALLDALAEAGGDHRDAHLAAHVIAMPISDMIVRTSAKSRLMSPWTVIRSEMPRTAWRSTSSAFLKVSRIEELRPATDRRRWLGMAISVSTFALSSRMPSSACFMRRLPSNVNGLVTTPTVSEPISLATRAITGAAPVPVPPPIPAVMKIMSAPPRCPRSRSTSSSAACLPTAGLPPAPRPR